MSDSPPPFGPPSGPPPQGPPPPDEVSYGWPEQPTPEPPRGSARRWVLVGGGVVAAGAIVAGAAFGAASLLGGAKHDTPAAAGALPATTFAFASIDADPSNGQLGDLLGILAKFPGVTKQLSASGGQGTTDPRKMVFDAIVAHDDAVGACHLSWDTDLAPWLGTQFAAAGIPVDGKPQPVAVVQVTDAAKAGTEVSKLQGCDHSDAYALSGSWLLIAPQMATIDAVTKGTAAGTLADDPTYQHWMSETGDPGIVSGYLAPGAGTMLADSMSSASGSGGAAAFGAMGESGSSPLSGICPGATDTGGSSSSSQALLRGFGGAALTLRVRDGGVEAESALSMGSAASAASAVSGTATDGARLVTGLPADTSAAIGLSIAPNPWESIVAYLSRMCGSGFDPAQINSSLEGMTGLAFPADIDTLLGKGLALSVGTVDATSLDQLVTGATQLPVALQFTGDAAGIQRVLGKVLAKISQAAGVPVSSVVGVDASGDRVVLSPSSDYRKKVLGTSGLGEDPTFQNAVPDAAKATSILYVDLDRFDPLVKSADSSAYVDYFAPLQALGIAAWADSDHTTHSLMRLTTD